MLRNPAIFKGGPGKTARYADACERENWARALSGSGGLLQAVAAWQPIRNARRARFQLARARPHTTAFTPKLRWLDRRGATRSGRLVKQRRKNVSPAVTFTKSLGVSSKSARGSVGHPNITIQ